MRPLLPHRDDRRAERRQMLADWSFNCGLALLPWLAVALLIAWWMR
jgi:hypothetical protein